MIIKQVTPFNIVSTYNSAQKFLLLLLNSPIRPLRNLVVGRCITMYLSPVTHHTDSHLFDGEWAGSCAELSTCNK